MHGGCGRRLTAACTPKAGWAPSATARQRCPFRSQSRGRGSPALPTPGWKPHTPAHQQGTGTSSGQAEAPCGITPAQSQECHQHISAALTRAPDLKPWCLPLRPPPLLLPHHLPAPKIGVSNGWARASPRRATRKTHCPSLRPPVIQKPPGSSKSSWPLGMAQKTAPCLCCSQQHESPETQSQYSEHC